MASSVCILLLSYSVIFLISHWIVRGLVLTSLAAPALNVICYIGVFTDPQIIGGERLLRTPRGVRLRSWTLVSMFMSLVLGVIEYVVELRVNSTSTLEGNVFN